MNALDRIISRRATLAAFAVCLSGRALLARDMPRMTAREIAVLLMEATEGQVPDLSSRDLSGLDLAGLDFKKANLSQCNLFGVDFTAANLAGADLSATVLDRSVLVRTNLSGASLRDSSIRRPSIFTNMRFEAADLPSFRNTGLQRARITAWLDGADFTAADLSGAVFALSLERDLGGAPASGLARCNFTDAKLINTNLAGLTLSFSIFHRADLSGANLAGADLSKADLTGAKLTNTNFTNAKLDEVIGL